MSNPQTLPRLRLFKITTMGIWHRNIYFHHSLDVDQNVVLSAECIVDITDVIQYYVDLLAFLRSSEQLAPLRATVCGTHHDQSGQP